VVFPFVVQAQFVEFPEKSITRLNGAETVGFWKGAKGFASPEETTWP
jgi:hypothetical protein